MGERKAWGGGRGAWGGYQLACHKLRWREEESKLLRVNASSYICNILVQKAGQRGGGNVTNIFDTTLM